MNFASYGTFMICSNVAADCNRDIATPCQTTLDSRKIVESPCCKMYDGATWSWRALWRRPPPVGSLWGAQRSQVLLAFTFTVIVHILSVFYVNFNVFVCVRVHALCVCLGLNRFVLPSVVLIGNCVVMVRQWRITLQLLSLLNYPFSSGNVPKAGHVSPCCNWPVIIFSTEALWESPSHALTLGHKYTHFFVPYK